MPSPLVPFATADASIGAPIVAATIDGESIRVTQRHHHVRGQLLGSSRGLISVDTDRGQWVVPATHAVWIPPGMVHGLRSHGPFAGWSAYVVPSHCVALPERPCILAVSGLLREVVTRLALDRCDAFDAARSRLAAVLLDEIQTLPRETLGLPMPSDPRVLRVAQALSARPADERRLQEWAAWVGMAPRTLSRRFVVETGFTLTQWRQRVRLLRALEGLAAGRTVTWVALELGYDNVSAFIALFRRTFGCTPGRYAVTGRLSAFEVLGSDV